MPSSNNLDSVINNTLARLLGTGPENDRQKSSSSSAGGTGSTGSCASSMTPAKALVIAGLIGDVFTVDSVLVDKDQHVEIVLSGSLKQKTQLEKVMDQIGKMPFDDVLKAIIGRLV